MKKSLYAFLTPPDEAGLSAALRALVSDIRFVDGYRWPTPEPPIRPAIESCTNRTVLLWSPQVNPVLPFARDYDGVHFLGPRTGTVVALDRGIQRSSHLHPAWLAASWEEPAMTHFVQQVWRALRAIAPSPPACVDPLTGAILTERAPYFRVGRDAARWCLEAPERFLRDQTVANHYRPLPSVVA